MKADIFIINILLITATAAATCWYAIATINLSGLAASNWAAYDFIRERNPLHLVRPEWIRGSDRVDVLMAWSAAELRARLILVFALCLIATGMLVWRALQRRSQPVGARGATVAF